MLLLVQRAAFVHDRLVLRAGQLIVHEGVDALAHGLHGRLAEDGVAEFLRLLQDVWILSDG